MVELAEAVEKPSRAGRRSRPPADQAGVGTAGLPEGDVHVEATDEASLVIRNDLVMCADLTAAQIVVGGNIEGFDADTLVLTLSDQVNVDDYLPWTIFIQHCDATVESMACYPIPGEPYQVALPQMPRLALTTGETIATPPRYEIVGIDDYKVRSFLIGTREAQNNRTHRIKASNYSFAIYQMDQLVFWLGFMEADWTDNGPFGYDADDPGIALEYDAERRHDVYVGTAASLTVEIQPFTPPTDYTKTAWIKRSDAGTSAGFLSNAYETFGFDAGLFAGGHGAAEPGGVGGRV